MSRSESRGFTLIELMIVVLVIAILAAIAIPSYLRQVRHSRRSDAIAQINTIALAEEQWRTNCPNYAQYGGAACLTGNPTFMPKPSRLFYTFNDISNLSATSYTITATPTGDQANDSQFGTPCPSLSYAVNNGAVTKSPSACWGQ